MTYQQIDHIALHLDNIGRGKPALHVALVLDSDGMCIERREFVNGYHAEEWARSWALPVEDRRAGHDFNISAPSFHYNPEANYAMASDLEIIEPPYND